MLLAAAFVYSMKAVRFGFKLFIDIVIYSDKLFCKGAWLPGQHPECKVLLVPAARKTFTLPRWQRESIVLFLLLAAAIPCGWKATRCGFQQQFRTDRWSIAMSPIKFAIAHATNQNVVALQWHFLMSLQQESNLAAHA